MGNDVISAGGALYLGSRLKRLGERMQADAAAVVERAGLPLQPAHFPLLQALDETGPQSVGGLSEALATSQPAVTRNVAKLVELGMVEVVTSRHDQRRHTAALTAVGRAALLRARLLVWPQVTAAVQELTAGLKGPLLAQVAAAEAALASRSLADRAAQVPRPPMRIRGYSDELATAFHDINAEWITAMYRLEPTDIDVLQHPRERIIDAGGDIRFVEVGSAGVVGACALQRTGKDQYELTKMGVLAAVRGLKAGEFLLQAMIERAQELGARKLYLLTNTKCEAAIHLYEKAGFQHDAGIMREFGRKYARCDVAMRYPLPSARKRAPSRPPSSRQSRA